MGEPWHQQEDGAFMLKRAKRLFKKGKYVKAARQVSEILEEFEEDGVTEVQVLIMCGVWEANEEDKEDDVRHDEE